MSSTIKAGEITGSLGRVLSRVTEGAEFRRLVAEVEAGRGVVSVGGLTAPSARALAVAALAGATRRRVALAVENYRDLETMERDVRFWADALGMNAMPVLTLPAAESDPYAGASPHAETLERRAITLWSLVNDLPGIVLVSARALARRTIAPDEVKRAGVRLVRDEDCPPENLIRRLVASGYVRQDPVRGVGEFSSRGGILDVWSPLAVAPVRIEFFGDTVDSIREFDS